MAVPKSGDYSSTFGVAYSDASNLNTVDIHIPNSKRNDEVTPGLWVVFIHGGAWRDPTQTSRDLDFALPYLSPSQYGIAGAASINYRLSPHPRFPAVPGSADEKARTARHPTHIRDVLTALAWLQDRYRFSDNYVLAGHSAGAMLAFQAVMGVWTPYGAARMPTLPIGITGACGVFDVTALVENHLDEPLYRSFIDEAFGPDQSTWAPASAVSGKFAETWQGGKAVVIAPSKDDELVESAQSEAMSDHLKAEKRSGRRDVVISLNGKHKEVVHAGEELAKAIIKCLEMVSS